MIFALGSDIGLQTRHPTCKEKPDSCKPVLDDSTRSEEVTIGVREPLPGTDRLQRRRVEGSDLVLGQREIRHPDHAYLAR